MTEVTTTTTAAAAHQPFLELIYCRPNPVLVCFCPAVTLCCWHHSRLDDHNHFYAAEMKLSKHCIHTCSTVSFYEPHASTDTFTRRFCFKVQLKWC